VYAYLFLTPDISDLRWYDDPNVRSEVQT
jgi:hypothetical protein